MKKLSLCIMVVGLVMAACSQNAGPGFTFKPKQSFFSRDGSGGFGSDKEPKILPETFYSAGRLFEEQNQWGKAAIQYQKAAAVKHDFAPAYDRLGTCLGKLGQHADAVKAFEKAVEIEPKYPTFLNNLGFAYATVEEWQAAETTLRKAVELQPDFARARINLGMVLCRLGRHQDGYDQFHAVLPETDSYYNLALMLRGQQRYQDAAAAFNHVLALNPRFASAKEQLDQIQPRLAQSSGSQPGLQIPFDGHAAPNSQFADNSVNGTSGTFSTGAQANTATADSQGEASTASDGGDSPANQQGFVVQSEWVVQPDPTIHASGNAGESFSSESTQSTQAPQTPPFNATQTLNLEQLASDINDHSVAYLTAVSVAGATPNPIESSFNATGNDTMGEFTPVKSATPAASMTITLLPSEETAFDEHLLDEPCDEILGSTVVDEKADEEVGFDESLDSSSYEPADFESSMEDSESSVDLGVQADPQVGQDSNSELVLILPAVTVTEADDQKSDES